MSQQEVEKAARMIAAFNALLEKDKQFAIISAFNEKPKNGIELLQESLGKAKLDHDVVNFFLNTPAYSAENIASELKKVAPTPQEQADFLKKKGALSKEAIGEYLGDPDPFNVQVLEAHANQTIGKKDFLSALRSYNDSFHMPGESQKIERFMSAFGRNYANQNPGITADSAEILAFSTIMLTSDLHKKGVKQKMTLDQFIANNRGINDRNDFQPEFLTDIYKRIHLARIGEKEHYTGREAAMAQGSGLEKFVQFEDEVAINLNRISKALKQRDVSLSPEEKKLCENAYKAASKKLLANEYSTLEIQKLATSLSEIVAPIERKINAARYAARGIQPAEALQAQMRKSGVITSEATVEGITNVMQRAIQIATQVDKKTLPVVVKQGLEVLPKKAASKTMPPLPGGM